jgi:hypothetical protein
MIFGKHMMVEFHMCVLPKAGTLKVGKGAKGLHLSPPKLFLPTYKPWLISVS